MSLTRINQNMPSLNAQRNLQTNAMRLQKSVERLSSGLRINRGADDPSGLIISEMLRAQVSSLDAAGQNAMEGINLVKTAEGALNEVNGLLRQMRNLTVSAASDSNHNNDSRSALQQQVASALTTLNSIATQTAYGKRTLLDGSAGTKTTVADFTHVAGASLSLGGESAGWVTVDVTQAAQKATVSSAAAIGNATDTFASDMAGFDAGDEVALYINGSKVNITTRGQNTNIGSTTQWQDIVDGITAQQAQLGVTATVTGGELVISSLNHGSSEHVSVEYRKVTDPGTDLVLTNALAGAGENLFAADAGQDAVANVSFNGGANVAFNAGSGKVLSHATHGSITLTDAGNAVNTWGSAIYAEEGQLAFQVGIEAGQTATVAVRDCRTTALGNGVSGTFASLADIDISTAAGATEALGVIDQAVREVSTLRGDLGAFQSNQLESVSRNLAVSRENLAASESLIRDTDFGKEMAEFTTTQILMQSAVSFLSQANNLPQNVMSLIRG